MWLGVIFLFVLSSLLGLIATATETCAPKACSRTIDSEKAVCASDGMTYPNRCIFEMIRCHNKNLNLSRRGQCKQIRQCSEVSAANVNTSFSPKCRADGSFDSEQCHLTSLYCWCVTPEGIPLPYTSWIKSNRDEPSRCDRRKTTRRRSPSRNSHKGRICKTFDKAQLNINLINSFHSEYARENIRNESDSAIITWKFNSLDVNHDFILDRVEYKELKKMVKKAIKPKKCAKQFPRNCDLDRDSQITQQEWDDCLARDGVDALPHNNTQIEKQPKVFDKLAPHSDLHSFQNLTIQNCSNKQQHRNCEEGNEPNLKVKQDLSDSSIQSSSSDNEDNPDYGDDSIGAVKSPPHGVLDPSITTNENEDSDSIEVGEPTDCFSDRKTALSEGTILYLPECTPDGRYQKVQCYRSAGYCFCVNEDTGKNIAGTTVKNGMPKCDTAKTTTRIMKGCPENKKNAFLKDLLDFFHNEMTRNLNSNNNFSNLPWIGSKEEQAATWSFVVLDNDKSKKLEKKEWKSFKKQIEKVKKLKKCGKRLPRYCDINKDSFITMTEWLDCLKIQQAEVSPSTANPRMGKNNPLSMLKDD